MKEEMTKQTIKAIWNNIAITIDYVPNYSNSVKELTGETLSHLEVRSANQQNLPITETGYRSHFTSMKEIEMFGGAEPYVCLLYTSPSPRDQRGSRMPSSA